MSMATADRLLQGVGKVQGRFYSSKNNKSFIYRSSYELAYMKLLEADTRVLGYEYEPFRVEVDGRFFVPDFLVLLKGLESKIVEVKSTWTEKVDAVKINLLRDLFSSLGMRYEVVNENFIFGGVV